MSMTFIGATNVSWGRSGSFFVNKFRRKTGKRDESCFSGWLSMTVHSWKYSERVEKYDMNPLSHSPHFLFDRLYVHSRYLEKKTINEIEIAQTSKKIYLNKYRMSRDRKSDNSIG